MPVNKQPLPTKPSDVIPDMPEPLAQLLETGDVNAQSLLTACLCATCGCNKEWTFGCSRKAQCFACCDAKSACNMFKLTDKPYCEGADACFCCKCVVCHNVSSCCDFPFPCDSERHVLLCKEQETTCGGASAGRAICCNSHGEFSCLQPTETPCYDQNKMFCLECRLACLPGTNANVPMMCSIFGAKLWAKA